jgi:hypothetical protein
MIARSDGRFKNTPLVIRFRHSAFGWRSQPAIERVHEAVAEIGKPRGTIRRWPPTVPSENPMRRDVGLPQIRSDLTAMDADNVDRIKNIVQGLKYPDFADAASKFTPERARS